MVRRRLQRRQRRSEPGLGRAARRLLGDEQSTRNAVVLSQRDRPERSGRDLWISVCAGAGDERNPLKPASRTFFVKQNKLIALLAAVCAVVWIITAIHPFDRQAWVLENILVILFVVALGPT